MPDKNNTNRGSNAVFLTNTSLHSRLRHKVLTHSCALSLPKNSVLNSQATKTSIFPMIFGKNKRSCTCCTTSEFLPKGAKIATFGKASIILVWHIPWGYSSVGRAPALQAGGQRFESAYLHQYGIVAQLVRARA